MFYRRCEICIKANIFTRETTVKKIYGSTRFSMFAAVNRTKQIAFLANI